MDSTELFKYILNISMPDKKSIEEGKIGNINWVLKFTPSLRRRVSILNAQLCRSFALKLRISPRSKISVNVAAAAKSPPQNENCAGRSAASLARKINNSRREWRQRHNCSRVCRALRRAHVSARVRYVGTYIRIRLVVMVDIAMSSFYSCHQVNLPSELLATSLYICKVALSHLSFEYFSHTFY